MIKGLFYFIYICFLIIYFLYTLKYYQDDHYHYRIFKKILYKYYVRRPYFIIIAFLLALNKEIVTYIVTSVILLLLIIEYKKIKKIKWTKRIIRIIILYILIVIPSFIIKHIIMFYLIAFPLLLLLIYFLESLITHCINITYYQKALKKIYKYKPFIIGITGSCGKTSIKNYLYETLKKELIVFKSDKSYNTINGLSMTINQKLNTYNTVFILEMGASHKKDIKKITKYFKPNISIISEILPQHLETFKTMDRLISEKMEIVKKMQNDGLIIINGDNEIIKNNLINPQNNEIITYGINDGNKYQAKDIKIKKDGIEFKVNNEQITSKLVGRHNVLNLLAVIIVLKYFKIPNKRIIRYIEELENYENRLEIKKYNSLTILNDSYNSNYLGFINALEILSLYQEYKMIITPGIVESGEKQEEINKEIAQIITKTCDFCYLVNNKNVSYYVKEFNNNNFTNYYIVNTFVEGFNNAKNKGGILLIENDLTDYYYLDIKRRNKE